MFLGTAAGARGTRASTARAWRLEERNVPYGDDLPAQPEIETADAGDPGGKTRRRAPGADPEVRSFGEERTCAAEGCETKLSRYNPDVYCSVHRGWDRQVITRRRRTDANGAGDDDASEA